MSQDEGTVTLGEVVALQNHLEASAVAVLGDADHQKCSYGQGYVKRQPLYACLTCTPDVCDPAGFCLACNYNCHDGHKIVELYTKRNFRCDCGNSKFGDNKCKLESDKDEINTKNVYNQNFKGKYCYCKKPYPDEDSSEDDTMIQCVVCEDWYHTNHLKNEIIPSEYSEMICKSCINKFPIFNLYTNLLVNENEDNELTNSNNEVDVINVPENEEDNKEKDLKKTIDKDVLKELHDTNDNKQDNDLVKIEKENSEKLVSSKIEVEDELQFEKNDGVKIKECPMKDKDLKNMVPVEKAFFWTDGWRKVLCKCDTCLNYYIENKIDFIIDVDDMTQEYEDKNIANSVPVNQDADLQFLSTLDRTQQVDLITEYNDMKEKLIEYLRPFGESNKVVSPNDIHKFFSLLGDTKRRRF